MYNESDLKRRLLQELKEVAKALDIPKYQTLRKEELVTAILDIQNSYTQSMSVSSSQPMLPFEESTAVQEPTESIEESDSNQPNLGLDSDDKPRRKRLRVMTPVGSSKVEAIREPIQPTLTPKEKPEVRQPVLSITEPTLPKPDSPSIKKPHQNEESKPVDVYAIESVIEATGVLEIMQDGFGFLRSAEYNYGNSPDDIYVSQSQIKLFGLKTGDLIEGNIRPPKEGEKYFPLIKVRLINGSDPAVVRDRISFEFLSPVYADEAIRLWGDQSNVTPVIKTIDLCVPIAKGQRVLMVSPQGIPRVRFMKDLAGSIVANQPDLYVICLFLGAKPEIITDCQRSIKAEVVATPIDATPEKSLKLTSIVIEKAKRMVECGLDVVLILDSLNTLARAYNETGNSQTKTLPGGIESGVLHQVKKIFGSARNIEGAGSLTILAAIASDTGIEMDTTLLEAVLGTENAIYLLERNPVEPKFLSLNLLGSESQFSESVHALETQEAMNKIKHHLSASEDAVLFKLQSLFYSDKSRNEVLEELNKI